MNKLSAKIIVIFLVSLFLSSLLPRMLIFINNEGVQSTIRANEFLVGTLISSGVALLLFGSGINILIIKRIMKVSQATKKIAKGDYEVYLPSLGKDEISSLISNFNSMAQTLKANEYLHKDFIRNFSHEIKTPISSIKGYAELIEASESNPENKEYLRIIIDESSRLSRLSQSMLQLSQIDSAKIIKRDEPYKVAEQIRNIIQLHQQDWEHKNLEFNLQLDEIYCSLNKDWLHQLWQNLITNAIRFSKQDGVIDITLNEIENELIFKITDHGLGIADQDKESIFKLFFVADRSRSSQSSGLGLSICKTIVDKLEGNISFESEESFFTTFTVSFPINKSETI